MSDVFSFWDGRPGPDGDSVPRSGWAETPEWYQRMVAEFEDERQAHLDTKAILTNLIAELVGDDGDGHELTGDDEDGCQVCAAIDRAEARLREVTGE